MDAESALQLVLLVAGIALCAVAIFGIIEAVKTLRSLRVFSDETRVLLVPILEKADVTVDAMNAELLRIDGIVTQIEDVSDRVSSTTNAVQEAVHGPLEAASNAGMRLRRIFKRSR